tara:strand:+ start:173 stop:361 length:189 start_codon:yes stop_codon:yes gene_type:complete
LDLFNFDEYMLFDFIQVGYSEGAIVVEKIHMDNSIGIIDPDRPFNFLHLFNAINFYRIVFVF